jgi:hypothetical protein
VLERKRRGTNRCNFIFWPLEPNTLFHLPSTNVRSKGAGLRLRVLRVKNDVEIYWKIWTAGENAGGLFGAPPRAPITDSTRRSPLPRRKLRFSLKRLLIAALILAVLAAAAVYGDYYRTTGRFLVTTDDAYVNAHSVLISPKVSGYHSRRAVIHPSCKSIATII